MDTTTSTMIALNPKAILKTLPKGFIGVSIPKKTRTVFLQVDTGLISKDDAKKAVSKLCKDMGLKVAYEHVYDASIDYGLEDPIFKKEMLADAKACLKVVKSFYNKYRIACRYDDNAGVVARQILRVVTNSEVQ